MWLLAACTGKAPSTSPTPSTPSTPSTWSLQPCVDSTPIPNPDGSPSGYEQCADGRIHRVSSEPSQPPGPGNACYGTEAYQDCSTDSDCGTGELCRDISFYRYTCECVATCSTDADCADDEICLGPGSIDTNFDFASCVRAGCRTDADCASGMCGVSVYATGCGISDYVACRSSADTCQVDADCSDGTCDAWWDPTKVSWTCDDETCIVR